MAPGTVRRAPYKDFLQPALHGRFTTTAGIVMAIAYAEAILLARWDSFLWSWFPLGPTGLRAFFLWMSGIFVVILRIALYHVGLRTSNSGVETFFHHAFRAQAVHAAVVYLASAALFAAAYLWGNRERTGMKLVTYFMADRARLNERHVFFVAHMMVLAAVQAFLHLYRDEDRLSLGTVTGDTNPDPQKGADGAATDAPVPTPQQKEEKGAFKEVTEARRFWDRMPMILISTINQSVAGIAVSLCLYPFTLRAPLWRIALLFLRPFYNLPRTNMLPSSLPYSLSCMVQCWLAGLWLLFMWQASKAAFSIYLVKEPLKKAKPLTNEARDPNGSLLNGLKSKKLSIKCFAMWELAYIARDFKPRRETIYNDIDRKEGPVWSQICAVCLGVLNDMEARIDSFGKAPAAAAPPQPDPAAAKPADEEQKKRLTQPPSDDLIFQVAPKRSFQHEVERAFKKAATSPGRRSSISPLAQKIAQVAKNQLAKVQRDATSPPNGHAAEPSKDGSVDTAPWQGIALRVLRWPVSEPLRQERGRRLAKAVLGFPYGEPSLYVNAAEALSLLATHSLAQDKYGNVQRDVAEVIRTFTRGATKLEAFCDGMPTHWTDVESIHNSVPTEVLAVLDALKEGLGRLVDRFSPYAWDLGLGMADARAAREAARKTRREGEEEQQPQKQQQQPAMVEPRDERPGNQAQEDVPEADIDRGRAIPEGKGKTKASAREQQSGASERLRELREAREARQAKEARERRTVQVPGRYPEMRQIR